MSHINPIARVEYLQKLFLQLHAIMLAEQESNWIRGISHILAVLGEAEANTSLATSRIEEACQCYRSMSSGNGSFSDFHIWRENFEERVKANQELSKITEAIWRDFESHA